MSSETSWPTSWSPTSSCSVPASASGSRSCGPPWPRSTPVVVELADGPLELGADEVELRVRAQPGFAVSRDGAEVLALDLALDDDLRRRGLAREVIRNVQDLRKASGLEVSDWIHLHLVGLADLAPVFDSIGREVLARSVSTEPPDGTAAGTPIELGDGESARQATAWVVKA
jgi:hypothetical protein